MLPDGAEITTCRALITDDHTKSDCHRFDRGDFPWNFADVSFSLDTVAQNGYRSDFDDSEDSEEFTAKRRRDRRYLSTLRRRGNQRRRHCSEVNIVSEKSEACGNTSSYVPSWVDGIPGENKAKSTLDINRKNIKSEMNTSLSDFLDGDGDSAEGADMSQQTDVKTRKDHAELEQEYLKLRRRIARKSKDTDDSNSDLNNTFSDRSSLLMTNPNGAYDVKDFLSSDDLGINHFRKHIHYVKSSSKKYKRSLRHSEQKQRQKRAPTFKTFKPLYELDHSISSESNNNFHHLSPSFEGSSHVR